jgi:hypothetical protein
MLEPEPKKKISSLVEMFSSQNLKQISKKISSHFGAMLSFGFMIHVTI